METGRKQDLNENDLYAILDEQKSSLLGGELEKYSYALNGIAVYLFCWTLFIVVSYLYISEIQPFSGDGKTSWSTRNMRIASPVY